jgi:prepilin-type N-terminal cleavage/methylation domain-containing protein
MSVYGSRMRGFTLVEIMVVVGIMGMVAGIGLPAVFYSFRKDPMRQGVDDVIEACNSARAQAILAGVTAELRISPLNKQFNVGMASKPGSSGAASGAIRVMDPIEPTEAGRSAFSAHLSDELVLEMLDVNLRECKDDEDARVRFYPNGTCDSLTVVLQWKMQQWRKISVDMVTGRADVEVIR